jgi:hypothetical protein
VRIDVIGAIWRDEVAALTWAAWINDPASVSWLPVRG